MKNTIRLILFISLTGFLFSCGDSDKQETGSVAKTRYEELEKTNWLLAVCQNNSPEGITTETWEKKNDSVYTGISYFVIGKDTVSYETINLEQTGKDLFYIPTVKDQNNGQPVKFILTSSAANQLVFENPAHDFPQMISYTRITDDSIVAEISAIIDGKKKSLLFPMAKMR
jgi:hypothetical protein